MKAQEMKLNGIGVATPYSAPTVDLQGRHPDHAPGFWVVVVLVFALVAGVVAYCISQGGDASSDMGFRWKGPLPVPYWEITCDLPD